MMFQALNKTESSECQKVYNLTTFAGISFWLHFGFMKLSKLTCLMEDE